MFVASLKEPVETLLNELEGKANKANKARKAKAEPLLVEARSALAKTRAEGATANTAKTAAKNAPEDTVKVQAAAQTDDAAAGEERALGTVLKELFDALGISKADQKIAVYRLLLGLAGIDADDFEMQRDGVAKDPDEYRRQSRIAIVAQLPAIAPMSAFLRSSASAIPREYSKLRSGIFEQWVQDNVGFVTPGPQFNSPPKPAPKFTGKTKRDSDGVQDLTLFEVKSHIAGGPSGDERDQMEDYKTILTYKLTDTKGAGPYSKVAYVFHDLDVQGKWLPELSSRLGGNFEHITPTE